MLQNILKTDFQLFKMIDFDIMLKKIHLFVCMVSITTHKKRHTKNAQGRSSSQSSGEGSTPGRHAMLGHPEQCG